LAGHTDNQTLVAAQLDLTWQMANEIESWPRLFAGEYAEAVVLERHEDRVRFRLTTEPVDGKVYSWVSERCLDRTRGTVTARRLETGPFLYMHIFQSFTETDGGTLLRWVQDFEVRRDAPVTEAQMQARIDNGARANLRRHKEMIEARASELAAAPSGPER
jgi:aromatase